MNGLISFLLKLGLGGIVDKTLNHLERRAASQNERERIRSMVEIEHIRTSVEEVRHMTDFNKAKLNHPLYWVFASLFVFPVGLWFAAGVLDSIFFFDWDVAKLPPQLEQVAGRVVEWTFYVGATVGGLGLAKNTIFGR